VKRFSKEGFDEIYKYKAGSRNTKIEKQIMRMKKVEEKKQAVV
jgi:hypothetical protein